LRQGLPLIFGGAAVLLGIALLPMPYGYYSFLRMAVTVAAFVWCRTSYSRDGFSGQVVLAGALALLFNPVIPVYLSRAIWAPIDLVAMGCFSWRAYRELKSEAK
jgi:hypothetical protein